MIKRVNNWFAKYTNLKKITFSVISIGFGVALCLHSMFLLIYFGFHLVIVTIIYVASKIENLLVEIAENEMKVRKLEKESDRLFINLLKATLTEVINLNRQDKEDWE